MKHLILATAGHVDHGKSALVQALTGTDPDRLPEEKARGITIVPGFAELSLTAADGETIHLGIVDVPGHEDFIKNMVAGVGAVNVALLVVAANEGWKAQTQEHMEILSHLGIARGVVALTKADLVDDPSEAIAKVRSRLERTPLAEAPIVPTAIGRADLLDELKRVLAEVCRHAAPAANAGKPRLSVDRVFTSPGAGTIVTGTLSGGTLAREARVVVQPRGLPARVRAVQTHGREVVEAGPGQRVALNLADVAIGSRRDAAGVQRGDVVTLERMGHPQLAVDVELRRSEYGAERPVKLRTGAMVVMHHGSSAHQARVKLIELEELAPGVSALARLTFQQPVFTFAGDRFIIRDSSARATLAGGVVLDQNPPAKLSTEQLALLRMRRKAPLCAVSFLESALLRDHWCVAEEALVQSRFSLGGIAIAAEKLADGGAVLTRNEFYVDACWWQTQCGRAAFEIGEMHRTHPDRAGLELSELRSKLALPSKLVDAMLGELCAGEFVQSGSAIARRSHELTLPPALEPAGARIRAALAKNPFEPPPRKQLAADSTSTQALAFLIRRGLVVELGTDLVMETSAYQAAAQGVIARLRANGAMSASELRELLGTNRRVIIPLLERMDRDGLTRRAGDKRVAR